MKIHPIAFVSGRMNALRVPASLALLAALAAPAGATDGAVYTMTNSATGNEVLIFQRSEANGDLTALGPVATGGLGTGTSLGNQSAMVLTDDERYLLVVNPGSDSISSFEVTQSGLTLVETVASGAHKPVSVDVHGDYVAVLHAGGDVTGETDRLVLMQLKADGTFVPLRKSRSLSQASTSPAQVKFVQDGHVLVVTEKATNQLTTFRVRTNGNIKSGDQFAFAGGQPFGFALVKRDQILVTDAMGGFVHSYEVGADGVPALLNSLDTTEQATCWAVAAPGGRTVFTTNTQSGTVSSLHVDYDATLSLIAVGGVAANTSGEPTDAALSNDGKFLYVLASALDALDVYKINNNTAALTLVETEPGLPDGANGLVAR